MELDSDSDSDLEFLAGQSSPQPSNTNFGDRLSNDAAPSNSAHGDARSPRSRTETDLQAQIDALKREMWEKMGENVILRSQLESNVSHHERELGELINKQAKAKDELQQELERQKKEVEKERIQIQFLQAEMRSKSGTSVEPKTITRGSSSSGTTRQINQPTSPSKRHLPAAALSDGFILKKQRIIPSLDSSQLSSQITEPSMAEVTIQEPQSTQNAILNTLFSLIATHHAPGYETKTLELLFNYRLPEGGSVGSKVSVFESYSDLIERILEVLNVKSLEDDCEVLLLALLFALFLHQLDLQEIQRHTLVSSLTTKLTEWLKSLNPLPDFGSLLPPFSLPSRDLRLLTCVLYTLDLLALQDYEFSIPHGLSRRLLTCSHAPQVVAKTITLLCMQPQSIDAELVKLLSPNGIIKPTIELLFSGLADVPLLSLAELCAEYPSSQKTCRLTSSTVGLATLRQKAESQAKTLSLTIQSACIQLAFALQYERAPTPIPMYSQVLAILTGHIDCPAPANNRIVQESVCFFWCIEPAKLRDELNEDELAELEVCLSKLVYAPQVRNETVEHGRQLLQALAGGADSDLVFDAFEPMDQDHVRLLHQSSV